MPLDGYMYFFGEGEYKVKETTNRIGNIKGESLDARFHAKGAFQIRNFTWDCERKTENNRLDSVEVKAFTVKKEIDVATPTLFLANVTGSVFPAAHVYFRKTTGSKLQTFFHAIF